ncbi:fer-1-like protein 5 isoform X2 [Monodelphis domestica]|uniref:fer-1-like protein 5 isoform X2 n=1 Tax=Monodelphis domestica TaxID=13616 RepID=UPI0024E1D767|nr:fer-1-like protein 5 isoform X2 [Monodelphis domestica]
MLQLIVISANVQPPQIPPPSFCVTVYFRDVKKKTRVIKDDNNPTWNETLIWHISPYYLEEDAFLQVILRDMSLVKNERTFGICTIFLRTLAENPDESLVLNELPLVSRTINPTKSTITLQITYLPEGNQNLETWEKFGITCKETERPEIMLGDHSVRRPLFSMPQDFQVQVKIFGAHQLHGNNIAPVVKILIGNKLYRTRIKKGINPFFNEKFFHNFHHVSPTEIFEEIIAIRVMDSRARRSKSEIGACQIDIGTIYRSPGHTLMRKWLGLCHSSKPTLGIRGYLKVTISVLGIGDLAPVDHGQLHETGPTEKDLFISATVPIRLANFEFLIYLAEDLHLKTAVTSRLFSHTVREIKGIMNPILELEIAGQILKTKPRMHTEKPRWEQTLKFSVQLPCMTNHIKLRVLDWNKSRHNDVIGTASLNITHISSIGAYSRGTFSGFLPCFGPSYIILHGGEKALSQSFLDEEPFPLLTSTEEGLIYRGRVLMELVTGIQEMKTRFFPSRITSTFIESGLSKKDYGLCVIFLSSTMMPAFEDLIHFEVTIGHYGNKMDLNYKPLASTTPYSQAVFDGTLYHFMPWQDNKPVVSLISTWEDIGYRMSSLNILRIAWDRLKSNLEALKSIQNPKNPALPRLWKKLLEELREDCKRPLPNMRKESTFVTILDKNLLKLRHKVLSELDYEAKKSKHEVMEMLPTAENWLYRLNAVLAEPQLSIPDVVIWLLCKEQRIAYARVPVHTILFSKAGPFSCGKFCGKAQTLFMQYSKEEMPKPFLKAEEEKGIMAAQLRVCMWLGSIFHSSALAETSYNDFIFYSETYENQAMYKGKWGQQGLKNYPIFSDVTAQQYLPMKNFQVPQGWRWEGNWFVEPQRRLLGKDIHQKQILEEVYENQTRDTWKSWTPAAIPNTDMIGQPVPAKESMECPKGWTIKENWNVELNEAVDDEGWEYGVGIPPSGIPKAWTAVEKTYHSWRRRRWVRQRYQNTEEQRHEQKQSPALSGEEEGWEYVSFDSKFGLNPQSDSKFRHRCWHRRMVPIENTNVSPIFYLEKSLEKEKLMAKQEKKEKDDPMALKKTLMEQELRTPFIYCIIHKPQYYQLLCYIYQARNLMSNHDQTFSGSTIQVVFLHYGQRTRTLETSLVPTWDQTLIFDHIPLYEKPQDIEENPPLVCLELWQQNSHGKQSLCGRSMCSPIVYLDLKNRVLPLLRWHSFNKMPGEDEGEVLAAFELILETEMVSNQRSPLMSIPWKNGYYTLPQSIQPSLKKTAIEILAWGLRNIKKAQSPRLLIECGGETLETAQIEDFYSNPNFPQSALLLTLFLPQEEAYAPPLVLKVVDQQYFGIQMVVGQAVVSCLRPYFCDPWAKDYVAPRLPAIILKKNQVLDWYRNSEHDEEEYIHEVDWWSKMLWATGESKKKWDYSDYYTLKVYDCELEAVPDFQGLQDFCQTFNLYYEKKTEDSPVVGQFKGLFRIYPLSENPKQPSPPRQFQNLSEKQSGPQRCLVRVYVVRAFNLQPKDNNGLCDPYVILKLGKTVLGNRHDYKPNTVDPIFGRMFELKCTIPLEKDLKITLFDFDLISPDDKIGSTVIDLENRLLSSFGARCGLPKSYCVSGPFQWRDQLTPSHLLERYAHRKGLPPPDFSTEGSIIFNGRTFKLPNFEQHTPQLKHLGPPQERLALYLLQAQGQVPEHVETRTLYSSTQPGIDQGKVQLWVDIFPLHLGPPGPAVNINLRKAKRWMHEMEKDMQKTDIHYRSLTGNGDFNWRFIFTFKYVPTEQVCILSKKEFIWSLDRTVKKTPPRLIIQVWDNDKFLPDDFLGIIELDLCEMPIPARKPSKCTLSMMESKPKWPFKFTYKHVSLFRQKTLAGWWPCQVLDNGKWRLSGKVNMTLEVLTKEEAEDKPAGKGRSEPNQYPTLHAPIRPESSFLWFLSPSLSIRYICWHHYRWKCAVFMIATSLFIMLLNFLFSIPYYLAMKLFTPEFRLAGTLPETVTKTKSTTTTTPGGSSTTPGGSSTSPGGSSTLFYSPQTEADYQNSTNYMDIFF